MLTVQVVGDFVSRRMGGEPSIPNVQLCNQAGEYLVGLHNWRWCLRQPSDLTLTSGQNYINLPADFGRIRKIAPSSTASIVSFTEVTVAELAVLRSDVAATGFGYYGAIVYRPNATTSIPEPKLDIWPTPAATTVGDLKLTYAAGWSVRTAAADNILVPAWIEGLYLEIAMAIAQGYDENDTGGRGARLAEIENSPELERAKQRDGGVRSSGAWMRGGGPQMVETALIGGYGTANSVANPS